MKKRISNRLTILMVCVFCIISQLMPLTTLALDNVNYQSVNISINVKASTSGLAVDTCSFSLYAADNIKDTTGNIILTADSFVKSATTSGGTATFSMSLPMGRYYAMMTDCPAGYDRCTDKIYFEINTGYTYYENIYLPSSTSAIDFGLTYNSSAQAGGTYTVTVNKLKNSSGSDISNMVYTQTFPTKMALSKFSTGTFSSAISYNIYYKTNLTSDWKIMGSYSSQTNTVIDFDALPLTDGEYVYAMMAVYGNVPSGFSMSTMPVFTLNVGVGARYNESYKGDGAVTGYVGSVGVRKADSFATTITSTTAVYVNTDMIYSANDAIAVEQASINDSIKEQVAQDPGLVAYEGSTVNTDKYGVNTGDTTPLALYIFLTIGGAMLIIVSLSGLVLVNKKTHIDNLDGSFDDEEVLL